MMDKTAWIILGVFIALLGGSVVLKGMKGDKSAKYDKPKTSMTEGKDASVKADKKAVKTDSYAKDKAKKKKYQKDPARATYLPTDEIMHTMHKIPGYKGIISFFAVFFVILFAKKFLTNYIQVHLHDDDHHDDDHGDGEDAHAKIEGGGHHA